MLWSVLSPYLHGVAKRFMFDCVIVGAGPAGGTAAYHLAKRGRSVVVLEKATLPRYKPCGGGVSPAIAQWFDFDFSPAVSLKTNQLRYTWKLGDPVETEVDLSEPIWLVRREVFDHFLIQQAQAQGAELREGTEVTGISFQSNHWQVKTVTEPVRARYLIAADGAKGPLAAWLGFKPRKPRLATAIEINSSVAAAPAPVHFEFGLVKNGYIWNFPKADGYSIGVGTLRGGEPKNFTKVLQDYVQAYNVDLNTCQQYDHALCLWEGPQTLHTQQALLAGEAARVADPFTAEGIRPAMFTGVKAAAAIDAALGGDLSALERYTQQVNEEWGSEMAWAQRLAGIFYRIPGVIYRTVVKQDGTTQRMAEILCGEVRYSDVAEVAIKRLTSFIPGFG